MKVLLIRHAATAGNEEKRYIGKTNEPLSPKGIQEAQAAGGSQDALFVYVTPLSRTWQTARIMFPNARLQPVTELQEMDFGDFEGRNAAEMESDPSYQTWIDNNCMGQCPGGESRQAFAARIQNAFEEILVPCLPFRTPKRKTYRQETLIFVIHGGSIMAILEKFARPPLSFYEGHLNNCEGFLCTVFSPTQDEKLPFLLKDIVKINRVTL